MIIDQDGITHDFCISKCSWVSRECGLISTGHSELVAEKVKIWIDEIIEFSET
jgi:hypothetical protein